MKLKLTFLFVNLAVVLSVEATVRTNKFSPIKVIPKVIYGLDDRMDVYESSDSMMRELSRSTAAQIMNGYLINVGDKYTTRSNTLKDDGICESERFSNQLAVANCSGFLVGPDLLVTAGHCINMDSDCENHKWVFDYANINGEKSSYTFDKSQVYQCTKIISREKNSTNSNDYALIKLDRPVVGRVPLKVRRAGRPADDAVFTVIGHPSGLPLKITVAADMRDNSNPIFFSTNADTYGGNSGSAVVDSRTGIVEGILVRGDQDYQKLENDSCMVSVHRDPANGRGEDVTRITNIKIPRK